MSRIALVIALLAGGCASAAQPAPISYGRSSDRAPPAPAASQSNRQRPPIIFANGGQQRDAQPARTPAVQEEAPALQAGAADPNWADGPGTALSTYALQPGDVQAGNPLNTPRTHRVGANESLYDIATHYQIPLRALIDQNHLEPPYALAPGRTIELPPPNVHVVSRNESLEDIARAYNVDLRSLALLNRMQPPYVIHAGDRIVLPAMARADASHESPVATPPPVQESGPTSPPSHITGRFTWPVRGDVVARFGAQTGGGRLDGIEIAGREGAPIVAAADGEVVYAGSDLPAYGTLVLVRHADDLVTAYAYARRATVHEGDRVRAGQTIAELGARSGGRPRLLFQVRRGAAAVDPTPLLGN